MSCLNPLGYVRSKFPAEILISLASVHLLWKFSSPSVASHWSAILNFAKLNPRSPSAKVKIEFKVDAVQKSFSRRFGNAAFFRVRKESRLVLHPEEGKRFHLVSEQRKTEEGDFWFWPREKWNESQKILLAPFFARSLTLVPRYLLLNRTETLATQAN